MMLPVLDERGRRRWAGVEASAIGRGGISRVAEATGLSRATVRRAGRVATFAGLILTAVAESVCIIP